MTREGGNMATVQQQIDQTWVQLNVRIPAHMAQSLKDQAEEEERTQSAIVRRALRDYLQDRQKQAEVAA